MFSQSVIEQLKYYVYFLRDPRDETVFYIGKGIGNRIFNHVACSLDTELSSDKIERIKEIEASGQKVQHLVLRHGLDESAAFEVEAALIDFVGLSNLSNSQGGHYSGDFGIKSTDEINAMYNAEKLDTNLPIMLININKLYHRDITVDELYEATRKAWVLSGRREKAKYAVATYRGLTREIYDIESWFPIQTETKTRWGFEGKIAPEQIRSALRYKSITHYFERGAANPIKYVNC